MSAKKFEYDCFKINPGQSMLQALNAMGQQGWEAFFLDPEEALVFVKREIPKIVLAGGPDLVHEKNRIIEP